MGGVDDWRVRTRWALRGAAVVFSVTFSHRSARTQVDDCDLLSVEVRRRWQTDPGRSFFRAECNNVSTSRAYVSPYNMRCAVRCAERRALSAGVTGNLRPHAPPTYPGEKGSHVRPPPAEKPSHKLSPWKKNDL